MNGPYPLRCRIRAEAGDVTRIDVYDVIGPDFLGDGVTPSSIAEQLAGIRGPLDVHLSSAGGDVFDGLAIAEAIRSHRWPVTTVVDGLAASIASVIVQAGQTRVMAPGSMMMIHDAMGLPDEPNEAGLRKMADTLAKVSDNLASQYAARSGRPASYWRQLMRAETWFTAEEAVSAGLADKVSGVPSALPFSPRVETLAARAPSRIAARLRHPREEAGLLEYVREAARLECARQLFAAMLDGRL